VPYPVDKIVERPVPYPVVREVVKTVDRPVPTPYNVPQPYEVRVPVPVEKVVHRNIPYPVEQIVEKIVHIPVPREVHTTTIQQHPQIIDRVVEVPRPYPVKREVTKVVEKKVPVPYEVPVEIQHEQVVVQPINVVEQEVVQINRRVEAGQPYVAGETVAVQQHAVMAPSASVSSSVVGVRATHGAAFAPSSSTALTIDAADGVIDGCYYGHPIVNGM
jgi:hypothetical protein